MRIIVLSKIFSLHLQVIGQEKFKEKLLEGWKKSEKLGFLPWDIRKKSLVLSQKQVTRKQKRSEKPRFSIFEKALFHELMSSNKNKKKKLWGSQASQTFFLKRFFTRSCKLKKNTCFFFFWTSGVDFHVKCLVSSLISLIKKQKVWGYPIQNKSNELHHFFLVRTFVFTTHDLHWTKL